MSGFQELREFFQKALKPGADIHSVNYRGTLLIHMIQLGAVKDQPSDAIFKAFAKVPMKVMSPDVDHESLAFDMEELQN
jgi:hypothetical protein